MRQAGCRLGLAFEPFAAGGIRCDGMRQHLERNAAAQPLVLNQVNLAHPPVPERGDESVGPEPGVRREARFGDDRNH
jgi:hypothetical protein